MMKVKKIFVIFVLAMLGLYSCSIVNPDAQKTVKLPNPASVYCEQNGGKLGYREDDKGGVAGYCLFADGSECEEWAYFRDECAPASQEIEDTVIEEEFPSSLSESGWKPAFSAAEYQGWWTYQNEEYGFSLMLPEDWAADELYSSDPIMSGHFVRLHPRMESDSMMNIRLSVRRAGEETLLWPTGVGEGDFVPLGTLDVAGKLARRIGFQCPAGAVNAVWYHGPEETGGNIQAGDLEFSFIASLVGESCQQAASLEGKTATLADMIVASLDQF